MEDNPQVDKKKRLSKILHCSRCRPHRNENTNHSFYREGKSWKCKSKKRKQY